MSTPTLYEISEHLIALLDSLEMCETPEQRLECEAEIYRALEAQVRKVDDFARFLTHLESQATLAAHEIERLKTRRLRFTNRFDRLTGYAVRIMQSLEVRKLEGETARLALRTNQPAVEIDDAKLLPAQFITVVEEIHPDKRAIKRAIEQGEFVTGAHLAAPTVSLIRT